MSKTALRKELLRMDNGQLVQIILDAYSAKNEIKEYFEFFLNPDIDKLLEKHRNIITKELSRTKWGHSKARVTILKKAVKDFLGFAPGTKVELDMFFSTLSALAKAERYVHFIPSQEKYVADLTKQIIKYGDEHRQFSTVAERFQDFFLDPTATNRFKRIIKETLGA